MRHLPWIVVAVALSLSVRTSHAQEKKVELKTNGWASLSGKVTLDGNIPNVKPILMPKGGVAPNNVWLVDKKTKAVANVLVWVRPPNGTFFPIHQQFKQRKDHLVIETQGQLFSPRISAINPVYFDGKEMVSTGQKFIVKNNSNVAHNVRIIGVKNGFNTNLLVNTSIDKSLEPERLPITFQDDFHVWMSGRVFVSDHPYYAVTKADGTFHIPIVPAGAEISVMGWHESVGYVLTTAGRPMTLKKDSNNPLNFEVKPR